jgi:hypothetical protein|tara:strand:+ start:578 stop:853 length:276 start_codon:yes stop_codon:yes gene_type:complete
MKLSNKRKLILPEDIIFELMDMTATLGEVAEEYHRKIGNDEEIENVLEVYHRIIDKLMNLNEYESIDENGKKTVNLEELVHGAGLSFLGES